MEDKLKARSKNKAVMTFEDVCGISAAQLQENQKEEAIKEHGKKKEHGNYKPV